MTKPTLEFHEPGGDWVPTGIDGQSEQILAEDPQMGIYTRLLKFAPGTDTSPSGTLTHDFWEEIYILSGEITDTRLACSFSAGDYACRPPGMEHGPWQSETGALLFEVRYVAR
ncbi:MAG: cupin domain-containing protein [Acidimicrobiales bacterium]